MEVATRIEVGPRVFDVELAPFAAPLARTDWSREYFLAKRGEPYKLLAHLACALGGPPAADIGCFSGASAVALAAGGATVDAYDIKAYMFPDVCEHPQIAFHLGDGVENAPIHPLISLDVDPHDGVQERRFVERVIASGLPALLVCDDIHSAGLEGFWRWAPEPKWNATAYGHHTGTGIIGFGGMEIELRDWREK